jgi:hypothetical protein
MSTKSSDAPVIFLWKSVHVLSVVLWWWYYLRHIFLYDVIKLLYSLYAFIAMSFDILHLRCQHMCGEWILAHICYAFGFAPKTGCDRRPREGQEARAGNSVDSCGPSPWASGALLPSSLGCSSPTSLSSFQPKHSWASFSLVHGGGHTTNTISVISQDSHPTRYIYNDSRKSREVLCIVKLHSFY